MNNNHHGSFDDLPLAQRMLLLATQADETHIEAWSDGVASLEGRLTQAVDALVEIANGSRWTAIQTRARAVEALGAMGVDPYPEQRQLG